MTMIVMLRLVVVFSFSMLPQNSMSSAFYSHHIINLQYHNNNRSSRTTTTDPRASRTSAPPPSRVASRSRLSLQHRLTNFERRFKEHNKKQRRKCLCAHEEEEKNDDDEEKEHVHGRSASFEDRREAVFAMLGRIWAASAAASLTTTTAAWVFPTGQGGVPAVEGSTNSKKVASNRSVIES